MAFGERHLNCYVGLKRKPTRKTQWGVGMVFRDIFNMAVLHCEDEGRVGRRPAATEGRRHERRRRRESDDLRRGVGISRRQKGRDVLCLIFLSVYQRQLTALKGGEPCRNYITFPQTRRCFWTVYLGGCRLSCEGTSVTGIRRNLAYTRQQSPPVYEWHVWCRCQSYGIAQWGRRKVAVTYVNNI